MFKVATSLVMQFFNRQICRVANFVEIWIHIHKILLWIFKIEFVYYSSSYIYVFTSEQVLLGVKCVYFVTVRNENTVSSGRVFGCIYIYTGI